MPRLRPLWWYRGAQIQMYPGEQMTWVMLSHMFTGIVAFVEKFTAVSMSVEILDETLGPVGTGSIFYRRVPLDTS